MDHESLHDEVAEMFSGYANVQQDELDLLALYQGKAKYAQQKRDEADHWLLAQRRKCRQCLYVRAREARDPGYKEDRRKRSARFAHDKQVLKRHEAAKRWHETGIPLPMLVEGRDYDTTRRPVVHHNIDVVKDKARHAKLECERRKARRTAEQSATGMLF